VEKVSTGLAWGGGEQEEQSFILPCGRARAGIHPFPPPISSTLTKSVEFRAGEKLSPCQMVQI